MKNPFDKMNNYCLENDATFEKIITSLTERSCSLWNTEYIELKAIQRNALKLRQLKIRFCKGDVVYFEIKSFLFRNARRICERRSRSSRPKTEKEKSTNILFYPLSSIHETRSISQYSFNRYK